MKPSYKIGVMDKYAEPQFKEIRGLLNPNIYDLLAFTENTKAKMSSFAVGSGAKGLYVWDSYQANHHQVITGENLNHGHYKFGYLERNLNVGTKENYWGISIGNTIDEAKTIVKQHTTLKDLLKEFPDIEINLHTKTDPKTTSTTASSWRECRNLI